MHSAPPTERLSNQKDIATSASASTRCLYCCLVLVPGRFPAPLRHEKFKEGIILVKMASLMANRGQTPHRLDLPPPAPPWSPGIGPSTSPMVASSVFIERGGSPALSNGREPPAPAAIRKYGLAPAPLATDDDLLRQAFFRCSWLPVGAFLRARLARAGMINAPTTPQGCGVVVSQL